jgi:hypothetical protein
VLIVGDHVAAAGAISAKFHPQDCVIIARAPRRRAILIATVVILSVARRSDLPSVRVLAAEAGRRAARWRSRAAVVKTARDLGTAVLEDRGEGDPPPPTASWCRPVLYGKTGVNRSGQNEIKDGR